MPTHTPQTADAILRRKQVVARTGLSAETIRGLILIGEFPPSFQLTGARSVGWLERDVDKWVRDRAARVPFANSVDARAEVAA